ncbi:Tigger transposable element-derived protein 4 [Araneus ventricosus]|uniref:Tigger transposable element-derived protein 4 n=1 Tax=Araneus ventricosus TaxID=182803 RepID=A0A4Y2QS58_ARAVE|nr:Tigger transposable element-derived protein 4 [Araneus ventricosus]GBN67928.1 Tigger transposable element-derived protein 4 [Araneus ventricosus]GBN67945.1 Tigger transposable element-derived protein 4 [Araneus ventricosus]
MDVMKKFKENPCTSKKALAEHFNAPELTLRGILKNREAIIVAHQECGIQSKIRRRIQGKKFEEYEKVLVKWFKEAHASNLPVNIELLRDKAVQLSKSFEMVNFSASHGWVEKFKNRHSLATHALSRESASVNEGTVEQWKEDLATLVNGYEPKNIYNCDKTGLFYKLMPDRTLTFKGEPCQAENECEEPGNESENDINEEDCYTVSGGLWCTFNEFVDANLITAQLREIGDVVAEINGGEEDEEADNDDEEDAAKVPPTHTVALEALETLLHYFQFNSFMS